MPLFTFDELSSDAQETALKEAQDYNLDMFNDSAGDNADFYFSQRAMNGVVADDALKGFDKFFMDTGRADYVQLPDMVVKNSKEFFKFAGLSENIIDKVDVFFREPEKYGNVEYDTEVQFSFPDGTYLPTTWSFQMNEGTATPAVADYNHEDVYEDYKHEARSLGFDDPEYLLTQKEFVSLFKAKDRVDDFISDTKKEYRESEEYAYSEESAQATIDDNEWQFDEDGVVMEYDGGDYSNSRYRQKQEMKQKERERQRVNALKAMARVSKVKSKELIF